MLRLVVCLFVLGACDQVFGLSRPDAADAADAALFDAPPDAQLFCPPLGTAPRFSSLLYQAITQNCIGYNRSDTAGLAVADCVEQGSGYVIAQGPIGGSFMRSTGVTIASGQDFVDQPRLSPDGDKLIVRSGSFTTGASVFVQYVRGPGESWILAGDAPFGGSPNDAISTAARSPGGYRLIYLASRQLFVEYEFANGSWRALSSLSASELGFDVVFSFGLSPDGLRGVVYGNTSAGQQTRYTERASLDARFGPSEEIQGLPTVYDAYLLADCSRVYFSSLGSIYYVQQL